MSEYLSPATSMVIGALIGIILITTLIIVICTFSLEGRRKKSTMAVQSEKKHQNVNPTMGSRTGGTSDPTGEKSGTKEKRKPVKPQKPLRENTTKPDKQKGAGGFHIFGPKIIAGSPKSVNQKPMIRMPVQKSEVKESARTVKGNEHGSPPAKMKQTKTSFFGNKKSTRAMEDNLKTNPAQIVPAGSTKTGGASFQPASAVPVATAADASPSYTANLSAPVPVATQPAGIAPPALPGTSTPAPEPEKKDEENTDSIFNLFSDTSGEESEISKFASNFDDVSMDSLLGDSRGILERFNKN